MPPKRKKKHQSKRKSQKGGFLVLIAQAMAEEAIKSAVKHYSEQKRLTRQRIDRKGWPRPSGMGW